MKAGLWKEGGVGGVEGGGSCFVVQIQNNKKSAFTVGKLTTGKASKAKQSANSVSQQKTSVGAEVRAAGIHAQQRGRAQTPHVRFIAVFEEGRREARRCLGVFHRLSFV